MCQFDYLFSFLVAVYTIYTFFVTKSGFFEFEYIVYLFFILKMQLIEAKPSFCAHLFMRMNGIPYVVKTVPFLEALGKKLPVLVHDQIVISGEPSILNYLFTIKGAKDSSVTHKDSSSSATTVTATAVTATTVTAETIMTGDVQAKSDPLRMRLPSTWASPSSKVSYSQAPSTGGKNKPATTNSVNNTKKDLTLQTMCSFIEMQCCLPFDHLPEVVNLGIYRLIDIVILYFEQL